MTAAPHEPWSVARLAAVGGVCAAHFARCFKAVFGVPPHRYLITLRLERAQALLRDTDRPVTEVAFACGWKSLGTFGRTFRDVLGESPSAFRARARAEPPPGPLVPICIQRAAWRPRLVISVSEKRRQTGTR